MTYWNIARVETIILGYFISYDFSVLLNITINIKAAIINLKRSGFQCMETLACARVSCSAVACRYSLGSSVASRSLRLRCHWSTSYTTRLATLTMSPAGTRAGRQLFVPAVTFFC